MIWKKILFIFNPVAGRSQIRNYLLDIIETLSAAEFKVVCYPTKGRGDARRLARERLDDYLYIACAGGDGTLDEVVSGMMENPNKPFVPIGYIPAGTTNDFASSLGIPSDMRMAAEIIAQGKTFRCDLGLFNETDYFTYVAAFGLFTGTSYETYHMHVNAISEKDGEEHIINIEGEFAYGMVTNSKTVGGFPNLAVKGIDLQDGLFEVTLVRMPKNPLELSEIFMKLGNPDFDSQMLISFQTSEITLKSDEIIAWTRDGEYAGAHKEVRLKNCHEKLKILVPGDMASP